MTGKNTGRRRASTRQPHLEPLEARRLLAGNVVAAPPATITPTLTLVGDDVGNAVKVWNGSNPQQFIVQGEDNTTVNGSHEEQVFEGVEQIVVEMRGGNDSFKAANLSLSAAGLFSLSVDGGAGDDFIELNNTTVRAGAGVSVQIYGERWNAAGASTTGNDTIRVGGTQILVESELNSRGTFDIFGELNLAGTVTGGNDLITVVNTLISTSVDEGRDSVVAMRVFGDQNGLDIDSGVETPGEARVGEGNDSISVSDTTIRATGGQLTQAGLQIFGDNNELEGIAEVGQGNDSISVTNTTISSTGAGTGLNRPTLQIFGDRNEALQTGTTSVVGEGNDSIVVNNTTVSGAAGFQDIVMIDIVGDENFTPFDVLVSAIVGEEDGGNDVISVDDLEVTANGALVDIITLSISGDVNGDEGLIGGGNDRISFTNSRIVASAGSGGLEGAAILIGGDAFVPPTGPIPASIGIGEGDDEVVLQNITVEAETISVIRIGTQAGDDVVRVLNCELRRPFGLMNPGEMRINLGDGDDDLWFNDNRFLSAFLEGGDGYDRLFAQSNIGTIVASNFEETHF
jgi:hypothetical protein